MNLSALAMRQLSDYDSHRPGALFAEPPDMTVEEAYHLQLEVAALRQARGEWVAGYKIGCISAAMQSQFGLSEAVFGHIWSGELHRSGAALPVNQFDGPAVEGELAVRLAADIPGAAWLHGRERDAVASAFAVIELHNYVFRNPPPAAQELIGNNALHAGVVLPPDEPPLAHPDQLLDEWVAVAKNGEPLGTGRGRDLPGGPFASIARLADHLGRFGIRLRRGQLILTGTPLPLYRVKADDRIEVTCGRSAPVIATFTAAG
jgi:2-keto-4-pentenoate hydratase